MSKGVKKDMSSVFVFGTKNFLATMGKLLKLKTQELPGVLCPEPAGDLKRSPDPSPTFVPPTQNPGSAPVHIMAMFDNIQRHKEVSQ
jgi:hypothetical protein